MDAVPGALEEEDDDVELRAKGKPNPVVAFVSAVKESWNIQLRHNAYINRYYNCCIRNLIRFHIDSFSAHRNVLEFYQNILSYKTLIDSKSYKRLMNYNHGEFAELLQQIHTPASVNTIGKYMAFLVMYLITASKERLDLFNADIGKIKETIRRIRHRFINRVANIHIKYKCNSMFVGIPFYLLPEDDAAAELLNWGRELYYKDYMSLYTSYLEYLRANPKNSTNNTLIITRAQHTWSFDRTVPEFVLKGLCYRHDDWISIKNNVSARFYLRYLPDTAQYVYYDVTSMSDHITIQSRIGIMHDIFAIVIGDIEDDSDIADIIMPSYSSMFYTVELLPVKGKIPIAGSVNIPEDEKRIPDNIMDEEPDDGEDRHDPFPSRPVSPPVYDDDPNSITVTKQLQALEDKINKVTSDHVEIAKSCNIVAETINRLERHADTLRLSMVNLARKIDIQTGYGSLLPE
ncbi:A type inclusion-like/fusion protein [Turkeypox virus]|uniref:A type inclusion-like/fusion protein n=1 Tax=Turkeypox virus TaxID=336486 RepID=A0A0M3ZJQ6_9POXV|nr:A type inclusion-like/fusion protein [Turkeypox virus]ALA62515.1 A type inclusion-like/fusion protein [Turkeypox virus]